MKVTKIATQLYRLVFICLLIMQVSCAAQQLASDSELYTGEEYSQAYSNPTDNPNRPNVLLIGDSISVGYTVEVRKLLKGKADVFRIPTNAKHTSWGVKNIEQWLANRKWDVIHFNWGLWDICYRNPQSKTQGHRDKINGTLTTTPDKYSDNLTYIVQKLKSSDANLIWAQTTPVPKFEAGRIQGDELIYNQIATKIMHANEVEINDLHSHAQLKLPEIQKNIGDVHFTPDGYKHLAHKVAQSISEQL